jgi:1,4-alpha-glucan branching enzyme
MPMSQQHITADTPLGANLVDGGATFRVWAPRANSVHLIGRFGGTDRWTPNDDNLMVASNGGVWSGFSVGAAEGDHYKFYVVGQGSTGPKRDPYARELAKSPDGTPPRCVVRDPDSWLWHDAGWRPPRFRDYIVYQFHVGTFYGPDLNHRVAKYLDVLDRLDYLVKLGVNAIEPLPITEFVSPRSLGYDGSDLFSPEIDYTVESDDLDTYLNKVNTLLDARGQQLVTREQLSVPINQLKALIDLCHLSGIAILFDVVYNHAGSQIRGRDEGLWFYDRATRDDDNDSLCFTDRDHAGPVFAIWRHEVRQFLRDNARFFVEEYHADGYRYDQVSAIVYENKHDGWRFCQTLNDNVRDADPTAIQIAEYWNVDDYVVRPAGEGGAGFDATWYDGLRTTIRTAIRQATRGSRETINLDPIAYNLKAPGFPAAWKAVQYVESHDEVRDDPHRNDRIAKLAGGNNSRSWYARSRSRIATGLILTAPGIPMLFMGQEFLESKRWHDDPRFHPHTLLYWEGLEEGDRSMIDHLRFTRELIALRKRYPALRSDNAQVYHVHNGNRVIAFHRWVKEGRDIVVVATLREETWYDYRLGLPQPGLWLEVFNSDVYDNWVNPNVAGNGGGVSAGGHGLHGFAHSTNVVIPANGIVVLARDSGD